MQTVGIMGGMELKSTSNDLGSEVINMTQVRIDAIVERLAASEAD
jgi:hypothetical protein